MHQSWAQVVYKMFALIAKVSNIFSYWNLLEQAYALDVLIPGKARGSYYDHVSSSFPLNTAITLCESTVTRINSSLGEEKSISHYVCFLVRVVWTQTYIFNYIQTGASVWRSKNMIVRTLIHLGWMWQILIFHPFHHKFKSAFRECSPLSYLSLVCTESNLV